MTYLVDANVLSEPTRPTPHAKVMGWLSANEGECVVDSIILGELRIGILTLRPGRKRTQLERCSMIAAKALAHGLTVATRNSRDFREAGAKVFDPFT